MSTEPPVWRGRNNGRPTLGRGPASTVHRTTRLARTQQRVALALGGEAGVRTLNHLGIATSSDTLLCLIRAFEPAVAEAVTYGGIDDRAYRRRYGD
ncbi:MAG: hypothetical protein LCH85_23515 [Chloroflexi bacterium]|nr:hypothetical protein [Chloroflexota bacterium]